jgi:hypothetical protein
LQQFDHIIERPIELFFAVHVRACVLQLTFQMIAGLTGAARRAARF